MTTYARKSVIVLNTTKDLILCSQNLTIGPECKRPLGWPKRRCQDNIKIDLQEVRWGGVDRIDMAQHRDRWRALLNALMNIRVPYSVGNFCTSCIPISFSGRALLHGVSLVRNLRQRNPVSNIMQVSHFANFYTPLPCFKLPGNNSIFPSHFCNVSPIHSFFVSSSLLCLLGKEYKLWICFYSKINQMHNISNLFYFGTTLYMFRTVLLK